jgi:D-alanine-D-alanine ligase
VRVTGDSKTRVAVVFGGRSAEHGVSCASAASIVRHLSRERYEVTPVRIGTDGRWTIGLDHQVPADVDTVTLLDMTREPAGPRPTVLESMWSALSRLRDEVDVAFPAMHGGHGEDGTVQSTLELFGIPYVGSGVLACGIGMDKELTKKLLSEAGLVVADSVVLHGADYDEVGAADRERLGLPVFVKPAREGSSVGVSRVDDWDALDEAITTARKTGMSKVLVEAAVRGREVDVGVLEYPDGRIVAGPPLEIRVPDKHTFFDFDAKYQGETVFDIPPHLPPRGAGGPPGTGCQGVPRVGVFGSAPRRLLPAGGRGDRGSDPGRERGQHDARLHGDVPVPANVERGGPGVSGAARRTDRHRPRPAKRPRDAGAGRDRLASGGHRQDLRHHPVGGVRASVPGRGVCHRGPPRRVGQQ